MKPKNMNTVYLKFQKHIKNNKHYVTIFTGDINIDLINTEYNTQNYLIATK